MKRLIGLILIALTLIVAARGQAAPAATKGPTLLPPLIATPIATTTVTPATAPPPLSEVARCSVRIDAFVAEQAKPAWHGSGVILSAEGQILTNAHVVAGADELVINLMSDVDRPPTPAYYAEPTHVDYVLDLALIQITADLDGNPVVPSELGLPALQIGDSDAIALGQLILTLGYPGIGGLGGNGTLTLGRGVVSGFASEDLGNDMERTWIKTDALIAPGSSGGIAIDDLGLLVGIPTAGTSDPVTGETLGWMRPISLVKNYLLNELCAPLTCDASIYEPNNDSSTAHGPLLSGTPYTAYIHQYDVDVYLIEVKTLDLIDIMLTGIPADADYDLGLMQADADLWLMTSEGEASSERIRYSPSVTGAYHIVVAPYQGYSLREPYVLQVDFNGDADDPGNVTVRGRVLNANTGQPIEGVIMALLLPGVTGQQFLDNNGDEKLVQAYSITDANGVFVLQQVPRGETHTGFIAAENDCFWEDNWLTIDETAPDEIDVGDLRVSAE